MGPALPTSQIVEQKSSLLRRSQLLLPPYPSWAAGPFPWSPAIYSLVIHRMYVQSIICQTRLSFFTPTILHRPSTLWYPTQPCHCHCPLCSRRYANESRPPTFSLKSHQPAIEHCRVYIQRPPRLIPPILPRFLLYSPQVNVYLLPINKTTQKVHHPHLLRLPQHPPRLERIINCQHPLPTGTPRKSPQSPNRQPHPDLHPLRCPTIQRIKQRIPNPQ